MTAPTPSSMSQKPTVTMPRICRAAVGQVRNTVEDAAQICETG